MPNLSYMWKCVQSKNTRQRSLNILLREVVLLYDSEHTVTYFIDVFIESWMLNIYMFERPFAVDLCSVKFYWITSECKSVLLTILGLRFNLLCLFTVTLKDPTTPSQADNLRPHFNPAAVALRHVALSMSGDIFKPGSCFPKAPCHRTAVCLRFRSAVTHTLSI